MDTDVNIRGNVCPCGEVWFCAELGPESDPSRCPFCGMLIGDGILEYDESTEDFADFDSMKKDIGKALGKTQMKLVGKTCIFCDNELLFYVEDASRAKYCSYCQHELIYKNSVMDVQSDTTPSDALGYIELNELNGSEVSIKFKSLNPFNRPLNFIFRGIDHMTGMVKLEGNNKTVLWEHLDNIKNICKTT